MTEALLEAIRSRLPELRLVTDPVDRQGYRHDETAYLATGLPCAVALPTETREVAELVRLAREFRDQGRARSAGHPQPGSRAAVRAIRRPAPSRKSRPRSEATWR